MKRKNIFAEGEIFHVFNKSIANYGIFKDPDNSKRFIQALDYYNNQKIDTNLGNYLKIHRDYSPEILEPKDNSYIKFISYCIMSDHYHLLIKILRGGIFSKYINDIENSFSRFFNIKFDRKGPLWQNRFKAVRIRTNEQLLHVCRYIHINPTTAYLVEKPEDWIFSSYKKIASNPVYLKDILTEISIKTTKSFKRFTEDNIDYQRKLKLIKKLMID